MHPVPLCLLLASGLGLGAVFAQDAAPAPAGPAAVEPEPAPEPHHHLEGGIGLLFSYSPTYQGSSSSRTTFKPGLYLRYGRWSLTSSGGFINRSNEVVDRGLTGELVNRGNLQVKLSARLDGGRDAGDDLALSGQHDVPATIRARLSAVQKFGDGWRLTTAVSPDVLARGGGVQAEVGLGHEWAFRAFEQPMRVNAGAGISWGNSQYMQSYFGVSPEEGQGTHHPVYTPSSGLRDVSIGFGLNTDLGPRWVAVFGFGAARLLGPALDSPLTDRTTSWGINGGLAWRF